MQNNGNKTLYPIYMKKLILIFNLLIIPAINLSAQEKIILEQADHAEYLKIEGEERVTLWGGVKLNSAKMKLEADWVQLNLAQEELLAKGKVILVSEEGNRIEGKEIKYNLETKEGEMKTPYIFVPPYYCRGDGAYLEAGTITLNHASLTTCDLAKPHYCLTSNKIIICPNDKIIAKNIFFKLGKVPLFYLPFYSKSLKPQKVRTSVKIGTGKIKGTSLGVTSDYLFSQKSIGSLHLNFLGEQGIETGIEHNYWQDGILAEKSYFYYIPERQKRDEVKNSRRWEISSQQSQRFKDTTDILHLQLLSDKDMTRDYLREGRYSASTWELKNYFALTKTTPHNTFRLVGERIDLWHNEVGDFEKERAFLPRLTFQTKSAKRNNIYYDLKGEIVNQFDSSSRTNYLKGDVEVNLLRKAKILSDKVVFTPKIGFLGVVKENEKASAWLKTSFNLRNRPSRYLEIDLGHSLKKEFSPNGYQGVEINALTSTLYLWLSRRMRGEITTGLDFCKDKDETFKINKTRLLPLVADLELVLSDNFNTSLKTTSSFKSSKIEEIESYFDIKKANWQYGGTGFYARGYTQEERDIFDVSNYLAFNISPGTHLRFHLYYDMKNHSPKEYGLTIEKDLHCWNSKFSLQHGKDTEFWMSFNIK